MKVKLVSVENYLLEALGQIEAWAAIDEHSNKKALLIAHFARKVIGEVDAMKGVK